MNLRAFRNGSAASVAVCLLLPVFFNEIFVRALQAANNVEHANVSFDISPNGQQIVFVSADGDLYLFHIETSRISQVTKTPEKETTPAFSPDGKSIIFAVESSGQKGSCLLVSDLNGGQVRPFPIDPLAKDSAPSYSPDGSQIVFARAHRHRLYSMGGWTWDDWDVYVMKSDGSQSQRITQKNHRGVHAPKFLPDGSNIVYSAEGSRSNSVLTSALFVVGVSGEQPQLFTKDFPLRPRGGAWASQPDVSTNGSIAFVSDRLSPFAYDVFVMNPDSTKIKALEVTKVSRYNKCPTFLPDGRTLLFLAGREQNSGSRAIFSLWRVDVDGKNARCLADSMLFTDPRRWKPNQ